MMEWSVLVSLLALAQYVWFGIQTGRARGATGVSAPAMTGSELFERHSRVHVNTLEQLVVMIPSLWAFSAYVHPQIGPALGGVYLIGRFLYSSAYVKDPASRGTGFIVSFLPVGLLLVGGIAGAILRVM